MQRIQNEVAVFAGGEPLPGRRFGQRRQKGRNWHRYWNRSGYHVLMVSNKKKVNVKTTAKRLLKTKETRLLLFVTNDARVTR